MKYLNSRYLYLYMKRTNQDEEKGFEVLKDLIELDITNKLFYDFIELLKDRGTFFILALEKFSLT